MVMGSFHERVEEQSRQYDDEFVRVLGPYGCPSIRAATPKLLKWVLPTWYDYVKVRKLQDGSLMQVTPRGGDLDLSDSALFAYDAAAVDDMMNKVFTGLKFQDYQTMAGSYAAEANTLFGQLPEKVLAAEVARLEALRVEAAIPVQAHLRQARYTVPTKTSLYIMENEPRPKDTLAYMQVADPVIMRSWVRTKVLHANALMAEALALVHEMSVVRHNLFKLQYAVRMDGIVPITDSLRRKPWTGPGDWPKSGECNEGALLRDLIDVEHQIGTMLMWMAALANDLRATYGAQWPRGCCTVFDTLQTRLAEDAGSYGWLPMDRDSVMGIPGMDQRVWDNLSAFAREVLCHRYLPYRCANGEYVHHTFAY